MHEALGSVKHSLIPYSMPKSDHLPPNVIGIIHSVEYPRVLSGRGRLQRESLRDHEPRLAFVRSDERRSLLEVEALQQASGLYLLCLHGKSDFM